MLSTEVGAGEGSACSTSVCVDFVKCIFPTSSDGNVLLEHGEGVFQVNMVKVPCNNIHVILVFVLQQADCAMQFLQGHVSISL